MVPTVESQSLEQLSSLFLSCYDDWYGRREGHAMRTIIFLVAIFLSSSCATPYQALGFRGGYEDFEAQPGVHFVTFSGNAYTGRTAIIRYWHMRAKEICPNGYEMISQDSSTRASSAVRMGNSVILLRKSRAEGYIRCNNTTRTSIIEAMEAKRVEEEIPDVTGSAE